MTSHRAKNERAKESALKRALARADIDTCDKNIEPPPGAVMANHAQLEHNNTYGLLPVFYIDRVVVCRDCGIEEVWTDNNQKWWYEVAKGNINSYAVRCRKCRGAEITRKNEVRQKPLEGLEKKLYKVRNS